MPTAINLAEKLGAFSDHWSPRIVAEFNGHDVMVVKAKGTFVWHSHAEPDDFFLVLKGNLVIQLGFRDQEVASLVQRTNRDTPIIRSRGDQRSSGCSRNTPGVSAGTGSAGISAD